MANVPLLGRAFRTDQLNHQTRQVAVFITATIVGENEEEFETGREEPPPLRVTDEALFREELNAALQLLEGSIGQ